MVKNILVRVYLDLKQYTEILETARDRGIKAQSDSELIRKVLFEYVEKIEAISFRLAREGAELTQMQDQLEKKNTIIEQLRGDLADKAKQIEILQTNIQKKVKK